MKQQSALFCAAALAASLASCRGVSDQVPAKGSERVPPPGSESTPENTPGAAERAQLGSIELAPSYPPREPGAPLLTPAGEEVSRAVNQERARLADAGTAADAGQSVGTANIGMPTNSANADEPDDADLPAGAQAATLVISAGASGELVPCGCSPDLRGGLPRAATLLSRERARDPALVFLDAGDLLFAGEREPQGPSAAQELAKARTLARGAALLGAAARVAGARDLAAGGKFVAETAAGVPLLDAGDPVPGARASLLLKVGPSEIPIGIFAAGLGPDPEKTLAVRAAALRKDGARFVLMLFHPRGDRALAAAQKILPAAHAAGVDLLLLAHRDDPGLDPDVAQAGSPPLLAIEGHLQSLLRLQLVFPAGTQAGAPVWLPESADGRKADAMLIEERAQLLRARMNSADADLKPVLEKKLAELEARRAQAAASRETAPPGAVIARARLRPLSQDLPDDPAAQALVASYDKEVAEENLAAAKKLPAECPRAKNGEPFFIGVSEPFHAGGKNGADQSCASCHASEAAFWARTRHARAYETLVAKGKQFSFDCIQCHVTGWQQPGGVCRIDRTGAGGPGLTTPYDRTGAGYEDALPEKIAEGRQGVQCEACHGPASEHVQDVHELVEDVPESTCRRCHDAANSPHFSMQTYRPWVVGPGHGEPLKKGEAPRTRGEMLAGNKLGPNPLLHGAARGAAQESK